MKSKSVKIKNNNGQVVRLTINENGTVSSIQPYSKDDTINCFAAIMRCGHCSRPTNYIPIIFPVIATSKEDALNRVLHFPRVKTSDNVNHGHCISIFPISWSESVILKHINDRDSYLTNNADKYNPEKVSREVVLPYKIKNFKSTHPTDIEGESIKLAEQYEENQVLQRFIAPIIIGSCVVSERKLPKQDQLLNEYIGQNLKTTPFNSDTLHDFFAYHRIFGHMQSHPFELEEKDGYLFCSRDGITESLELPQNILDSEKKYDFDVYKKEAQKEDIMEQVGSIQQDEYEAAMQDRRERIYEKFAKMKRPTFTSKDTPQDEFLPGNE